MYGKHILGILILFAAFLALAACANPPTEEMDAARSALARAEDNADAVEYAPESITRAHSLVRRMERAAEEEEYDSARSLALEAVSAAEQAIVDGAAAKEDARNDASAAISEATDLLNEVEQALAAAGEVRGLTLDTSATTRELDAVAQEIAAAEDDFAQENYISAQNTARDARSSLAGIQRRIAEAVQAATRRK